jgi:single-stranded DNA-specific DHH superfamily exonuclease
MGLKNVKNLNRLLPLVAVGTIADCQSVLEKTNRLLVRSGLQMLQKQDSKSEGLLEILKQLGFLEKIQSGYQLTSQELGFYISPVLNSSGRLSHARLSIRSLLSPDFVSKNFKDQEPELKNCNSLEGFVKKLIQTNQERKDLVKKILEEVELKAKQQFLDKANLIWLEGPWNKGIIGLLASRLVNQYQLPVVIIEVEKKDLENELVTASLRAPEGFNLPQAMTESGADLFIKYGGHPGAAGFTATFSNLKKIKEALSQNLDKQKKSLQGNRSIYQDAEFEAIISEFIKKNQEYLQAEDLQEILDLKYISNLIYLESTELKQDFLQELMLLDPFGQDFPAPHLVSVFSKYSIRWLGLEQKHVKINFANNNFTVFNISSSFKQKLFKNENKNSSQEPILAILKTSQNTFRGSTSLDLIAEKVY